MAEPAAHGPAFSPGDELIARWTTASEDIPRHLKVTVIEQVANATEQTNPEIYYRVQTNMGVTMVLAESDLAAIP